MTRFASQLGTHPQWLGRLSSGAFALGLFAIALGASCSTSEASDSGSSNGGFGGSAGCVGCGGDPGDGSSLDVPLVDAAGSGGTGPVEACGVGECQPDDALSCKDYMPSAGSGGAAQGGTGGGGGAGTTAGAGGTGGSAGGGEAGSSLTGGAAGAGGAAGQGAGSSMKGIPPGETPVFACHIRREGASNLVRRCELAGAKDTGEPCTSSGDCMPGLGCVGEENLGRCRPFCCDSETSCAENSFCAERPLRDDASAENGQLSVPVCAPADNCSLGEPYPCDNTDPNAGCVCKEGTACTVVRADGTTSCVPPGAGTAGQECPCAAGHICSQASGRCVRICKLGAANSECGTGRCQAPANFPEGYGVCVSSDVDSGQ
ncbi:MAG: hypothetical protein H6718_17210 [Polyangiaceae bacterium]|nr:hypothetical protein [Myxococcales bacterium]MCB9587141.1 hypothetical protein [Polyangiaceae bacterium]